MRDSGFLGEIHILRAVVKAASVTSAAEALGMAKSSVSARLGELEKRVGARLLTRSRGGMQLTPAG